MIRKHRSSNFQHRTLNCYARRSNSRCSALLILLVIGHSDLVIPSTSSLIAAPPTLLRLTDDGHFKQRPAWSPSGKTLAFARHQGATIMLFLREMNGDERRLTESKYSEYDAVFSPDGQRVIMSLQEKGNANIYTMDLRSRTTTRLTSTAAIDTSPSYSPDGKQIV